MKNIVNNKIGILFKFFIMAVMVGLLVQSCEKDDLEIQKNFPFELEVMPVPKYVAKGETVEIRCRIIPNGNYTGTTYLIRYFQYEGQGSLRFYLTTYPLFLMISIR